jgi:hypothetical protein
MEESHWRSWLVTEFQTENVAWVVLDLMLMVGAPRLRSATAVDGIVLAVKEKMAVGHCMVGSVDVLSIDSILRFLRKFLVVE